ncbi:hypothetical protein, partial [Nocardia brasiliensis]|uniref:hypothetical protein n=1 Tax=Nocardia brasiliensis TaxID=37326 RepID=UPI002457B146
NTTMWGAARGGRFIAAVPGIINVVAPWLAAVAAGPYHSAAAVIAAAERMLPDLWRQVREHESEDQLGPTTAWTYFFDAYGRPTRISVSSRTGFSRGTETRTGFLIHPRLPVDRFTGIEGNDADLFRIARHVADYCSAHPEQVGNVAVGGEASVIRLSKFGGARTRKPGRLS